VKNKALLALALLIGSANLALAAGEAPALDPNRFGAKVEDDAFGAYQRGLYRTALDLALIRAKDGDAAAQTLAAEIYSRGLGVPLNPKEATRLYGLAAEQGVIEAQFQMALVLIDGKYAPKDVVKAKAYLEKAVAAGHALAGFNLAQLILSTATTDEQRKAAFDLFLKAALAGLPDAQYAVSQYLANGTAGVPLDEVKARGWMEKAARQNYDTAQLDLGNWMIAGKGGKKDYETGFLWMKRAAEGGTVEAQRILARLYYDGVGTKGDSISGAAWYIIAKRSGLHDPYMDDVLDGLDDGELKKAIELANRLK
jgi:uncharacterized protein